MGKNAGSFRHERGPDFDALRLAAAWLRAESVQPKEVRANLTVYAAGGTREEPGVRRRCHLSGGGPVRLLEAYSTSDWRRSTTQEVIELVPPVLRFHMEDVFPEWSFLCQIKTIT